MKKKSIGINSIIYILKIFITLLVPMITFPYASRILGTDGIGKVNFSVSIVNYFVLLAGLGIQTYAIRECSKYRERKDELQEKASEIFSINIYSTIVSWICYIIFILNSSKMNNYRDILVILGIMILVNPFSMEWIYNVFEEFIYITVRTIIVQIIAVLYLVIFVDTKEDILQYAFFTVCPVIGSNFLNFFHAKKYIRIRLVWNKELLKHMKPICILFASAVTCTIYLNSDMTMLGIYGTDDKVGFYTAATKLYTMIRNILFVIITVSLPRFNFFLNNERREEFICLYKRLFNILLYIIVPVSVGTFWVSNELILLLCGSDYINAVVPLKILAIAIVPTMLGSFWSNIVLVPLNKEKNVLIATLLGAFFNIGANVFVLPQYFEQGAAVTTLLSEVLVLIIHTVNIRKTNLVNFDMWHFFKACIGTGCFYFIVKLIRDRVEILLVRFILEVVICALVYGIIIFILNFKIIRMEMKTKKQAVI